MCFKYLRQSSCPSWTKVLVSSRKLLDHLDDTLSFQPSVWDVQDTQTRYEHGYWSNDRQQTSGGRDSPMAKERTLIHILLTFGSILSSLFCSSLYRRIVKAVCPNTHPSTTFLLATVSDVSPSLNKRDFYWTLQTALEPKLRFIAILETTNSRGSNLRNSVRLNQKIPGSIKPRTRNPMKCFTVRD